MASNVTIKAIDSSAVHQIQAGQVIVDLCSVAKELVENAVDAGATTIEVKFKNQGLDSIEVQDNGAGIEPHNYEPVALKHYTSKLSTYDDLSTLQTFGFRGEALSSLCALSKFSVVTCTKEQVPRATKLEFEMSGKLKSTSVVSGQRGTSVFVEDLFRNLPVRRRELERNIKREWGKVISLLNQYACIQTGVKFTVSQQPTKGKRMILFSTKGNPTTRENIINVFGVKTMNALITMDLKLQLTPTAGPLVKGKARADGSSTEVRVLGHVSKPTAGEGRQTPDRQMFYVNGRPCGLPQFVKVINEVYRSYNSSQLPFIFADIQLDTHLYDVNVSPDKRTILLHDQGQMLDNLRESLIELFETQDVTIPMSQAQGLKQTPFKKPTLARSQTPASVVSASNRRTATPSHHSSEPDSPPPQRRPSVDPNGHSEDKTDERDEDSEDQDETEAESTNPSRRLTTRPGPSATSSQSSPSLSRWLERKPVSRGTSQLSDKTRSNPPGPEQDEVNSNAVEEDDREDLPSFQASQIQGFHADSQPVTQQPDDARTSDHEMEDAEDEPPQSSIPVIPPPSQPPAPRSSPMASARFKRSTQEVATITIGDSTVTSVIRSPLKRSRIEEPSRPSQRSSATKAGKRTVPMPSFGGRLTQMFSAASSRKEGQMGDLEITTEEVDVEDEDIEEVEENEETSDAGEPAEEQEDDNEESLFVSQGGDNDVEMGEDEAPSSSLDEHEESQPESGDNQGTPLDADSPRESVEESECCDHDAVDDEYIDEEEKKAQEDKKVQALIDAAEAAAVETSEESEKRSQMLLKGRPKRKDMTLNLIHRVKTNEKEIHQHITSLSKHLSPQQTQPAPTQDSDDGLEAANPEEKLSLKITKTDFAKMQIIGQFNLGFILAVRSASSSTDDDELFIIDQHASDEKYNFERLQSTTTVQSQRLVQPKLLTLTAVEEEIILENLDSLERNGFVVATDTSGDSPVGSRCQLLTLPLSRETTFDLSDLEELIFLLGDNPTSSATTIPRPSKVRKMFAMRACRSSIMIGRALSERQMEKVVRHMGEMEKPWNCPHGRPTMRHLCGLGSSFEGKTWQEGRMKKPDWKGWLGQQRKTRKGKGRAE
ncbi:mismatch repair endonuclease PMS2 [Triangularia verruculosa]|uniref:DNA mismatch repair protein PMS1 n=1 Tax=Triangularia verruculosa TaxID=2587418 RepID=A0AAN6XQ43_9PEZI|nr:mismatch repair endonuclease PMS2 [Triangularia verruculosa]